MPVERSGNPNHQFLSLFCDAFAFRQGTHRMNSQPESFRLLFGLILSITSGVEGTGPMTRPATWLAAKVPLPA